MGAAAAAVMIRKERDLVEHFRRLKATSPESARPRQDFNEDSSNAWNRLIRHAVIREAAPGTWYVDELSYAAMRNVRRRIVLIFLAVVLVALLAGILIRP